MKAGNRKKWPRMAALLRVFEGCDEKGIGTRKK